MNQQVEVPGTHLLTTFATTRDEVISCKHHIVGGVHKAARTFGTEVPAHYVFMHGPSSCWTPAFQAAVSAKLTGLIKKDPGSWNGGSHIYLETDFPPIPGSDDQYIDITYGWGNGDRHNPPAGTIRMKGWRTIRWNARP